MPLFLILAVVVLWLYYKSKGATAGGTGGVGSSPLPGDGLDNIGEAIARFEGFYTPGSVAQRTNNPGNVGTWGGHVGDYATVGDGWNTLNGWLNRAVTANPTWDFYDMSRFYLTGDTQGAAGKDQNPDAYAEYIANYVGVDPTQTVSSVMFGG